MQQQLLEGKVIDYDNELRIREAETHWQDLLERWTSYTQLLTPHDFSFGGHSEKLFSYMAKNSGFFIDLV
jgi:hypothetical protein